MTEQKNIAQLARKKLYSNLLAKLNTGKTLNANERQTFDELNNEYDAQENASLSGIILATNQMEQLFGVVRKTVAEWTKAGMPKVSYGRYDLFAVMKWWQENVNSRDSEDINLIKMRFWGAKADKAEIDVRKAKGALIPRAQLVTDRVSRCLDMRQSLLALSARLESVLEMKPRPVIRATIDAEIRKMLEAFSAPSELWPAEAPKPAKKTPKKNSKTTKGKKK
jgi:hypothetical protein